jgi:hypothetical protein
MPVAPEGEAAVGVWDCWGGVVLGFDEVADGDEDDYAVSCCWGGGGVDATGDVYVEAGFIWDELFLEDAVEGLAVVVCEEDVVWLQSGYLLRKRPVEADTRARSGPL